MRRILKEPTTRVRSGSFASIWAGASHCPACPDQQTSPDRPGWFNWCQRRMWTTKCSGPLFLQEWAISTDWL